MIYVDELTVCIRSKKWPYRQACHLMADSEEELHYFAGRMGLFRSWFQRGSLPHYDLTKNMRLLAVKLGAVEIDRKKFVELMEKYRLRKAGH